jgi:hypothetical protein
MTMPFTYIENVGSHEGEEATLRGWVYNKRSSGKPLLSLAYCTGFILDKFSA